MDWINVAQDSYHWRAVMNKVMKTFRFHTCWEVAQLVASEQGLSSMDCVTV
jgi:hypothetical protein